MLNTSCLTSSDVVIVNCHNQHRPSLADLKGPCCRGGGVGLEVTSVKNANKLTDNSINVSTSVEID